MGFLTLTRMACFVIFLLQILSVPYTRKVTRKSTLLRADVNVIGPFNIGAYKTGDQN